MARCTICINPSWKQEGCHGLTPRKPMESPVRSLVLTLKRANGLSSFCPVLPSWDVVEASNDALGEGAQALEPGRLCVQSNLVWGFAYAVRASGGTPTMAGSIPGTRSRL